MGKSRLALAVLLATVALGACDKQPAQGQLYFERVIQPVYQGGTFPSPLVGQSPTSLPPPREGRARFGTVRA